MGEIARFPTLPPAPAVMAILSRFNREQLHGFIAVAIDLADAMDGNPDAEDDDPAGQYDEDYYTGPAKAGYGPGCTISDDDHGIDDLRQGTPGLDC